MAGQPERTARSSRSWGSQGGFSKRNGISHSLYFISEGRTLRSVTEIFWYPHLYASQGAPHTPRAGAARTSGSFGVLVECSWSRQAVCVAAAAVGVVPSAGAVLRRYRL
jgi:hypothetical protein